MGLGALTLKLRQRYGHGLRTAWYRDHVRPRILATAPVTGKVDPSCEIHVLTCAGDWLNLVWTLKSFYRVSDRHYALCIHEDGSLSDEACASLRQHFPNARLIRRPEADAWAESVLRKDHPRLASFRAKHPLSLKITDFIGFLDAPRMLVFDSDLLFFRAPTELLARAGAAEYTKNTFNEDIESAYAVDEVQVRDSLGVELIPRFNSGLGLVHRGSITFDLLERLLDMPGLTDGHFWRIEQTLFALCSCMHGVELLPPEYQVHVGRGAPGIPMRHYVGAIRHLMYAEGMRWLSARTDILRPAQRAAA